MELSLSSADVLKLVCRAHMLRESQHKYSAAELKAFPVLKQLLLSDSRKQRFKMKSSVSVKLFLQSAQRDLQDVSSHWEQRAGRNVDVSSQQLLFLL